MYKPKSHPIYTGLVELYLRATIRNWKKYIPKEWYEFATMWLELLSDEDRKFLEFVFGKDFYYSADGVACYQSETESHFEKRERLYRLEQKFAIDGGLIIEKENKENE